MGGFVIGLLIGLVFGWVSPQPEWAEKFLIKFKMKYFK